MALRIIATLLLLGGSVSAFADVTGSVNFRIGTANSINFDTQKTGANPSDVAWDGNTLRTQGSATLLNLGVMSAIEFAQPASYFIQQAARAASSNTISANTLVQGDTFVVVTNAGSTVKARVIVVTTLPPVGAGGGSTTITVNYTTFIGQAPGKPFIAGILNNSSLIEAGQPNYGIAPSSLFIITGTFLSNPADIVLQSSAPPGLPLTLNGASINVVVNGTTVHPALYYAIPSQIAAVLPAGTPPGQAALTVTLNGKTSDPTSFAVVPSALGINTYYGVIAVATDAINGALITYRNSAAPGEILTLWATGLGADPLDSDTTLAAAPHAVNTPLEIYVGGLPATVLYAGASPYPGVNQINFVIPSDSPAGCFVTLTAVTRNVTSNTAILPIQMSGGECSDEVNGFQGGQVPAYGPITVRGGNVVVLQTNPTLGDPKSAPTANVANAAFETYANQYYVPQASPGGCLVNPPKVPVGTVTALGAGTITVTGPNGVATKMNAQFGAAGAFTLNLGANGIPATGGTFTFTGSGGKDVGPFTATATFVPPLLAWTNQSSLTSVNRSQGVTFRWTGGNPGSFVYLSGASTDSNRVTGRFLCVARVEDGQFTVPPYVLLSIPAGTGALDMQNIMFFPMSASGLDTASAGIDIQYAVATQFSGGTP
jgi:uncharacterized protein (TIGR03437 family)